MARKVSLGFEPSKYQQELFDFVQHGAGNGVIEAYAGSGKTTTCVAAMKYIPKDQKCLYIAFNKSIAEELNEKLKGKPNCTARTTHSLGYKFIQRNLGSDVQMDEYKYRNFVKSNITELTTTEGEISTQEKMSRYIDSICMLINFSRLNLAQSEKEIFAIAEKYSIPVSFDECVVTEKCLEWGKEHYETIDYIDMLWLPVELSLKPIGLTYDWVFIDEVQDISVCTVQLFFKCIKRGGRFIAVGDQKQNIYSFAGASRKAFDMLRTHPNTKSFQLPISYRCPLKVIELAKQFVEDIQARENAPEGNIVSNVHIRDIKEGDMVLCRSRAPLVTLYTKLLRRGVSCYIKGQDIAASLINELEKIDKKNLNSNLDEDGVFVQLYDSLFTERNKLMINMGLDYEDATLSSYIMDKFDAINTLQVLGERLKTKQQLIDHINMIFKENEDDIKENSVCLSTIHKAKGLECDNVYILCHSSMPSKLAEKDWEIEQENNLIYVAYTRAKKTLGFISEKEVPPMGNMQEPNEILNEMNFIEQRICKVLLKEPMPHMENTEMLRFKLKNATKIEDMHEGRNTVEIHHKQPKDNNDEDLDLLSELEHFI